MYSGEQAVTTLRVIKAAQRLGFSLDEVAELIEVGRRRGPSSGLQVKAQAKLAEVEQRIVDLETIRTNLVVALDAGCDDLHECEGSDCCPIPFVDLADVTGETRNERRRTAGSKRYLHRRRSCGLRRVLRTTTAGPPGYRRRGNGSNRSHSSSSPGVTLRDRDWL